MKDIFHDLYNKVLSFFTSTEEVDPTKGVAINRLKTVLLQDRAGFSERAIQMMKEELVSVVSKYMEIDDENFQLQIDALENKTILNLSIPVTRPKTDDEIDEAIKEQSLKNQKKAEEIVKELEGLIKEKAMALADGEEIDSELIEKAQKNIEEKDEETENKEEKAEEESSCEEQEEKKETETKETAGSSKKKKKK
ncbi:MAG: cell division topological specificity factor MinE [Candidatus Gastranaerophilales bacterium]|nr:cell division topological specificity factor MinE [Candidatus Gastranaerophilales bacterium]